MGWKTGAAAGAGLGMWGGPIGAAIGAGIGAAIGAICEDEDTPNYQIGSAEDSPVSIYLTEEGLSFPIADLSIKWQEVVKVAFDGDDGNDEFVLVGGIGITCPSSLVQFISDDEDERNKINKIIRNRKVSSIDETFDEFADDESTENILETANHLVVSIAICKEILHRLQSDDNLIVDFLGCVDSLYSLAKNLNNRFCRALDDPYDYEDDALPFKNWDGENIEGLMNLATFFIEEISADPDYSQKPETLKLYASIIAEFELIICEVLHPDHEFAKSDYALYHTAVSVEDSAERSVGYSKGVNWLAYEFSKEEYDKERKVIVCTDEPRGILSLHEEIPGVSILRAESIEAAIVKMNEYDEEDERFRYQSELEDFDVEVTGDECKKIFEKRKARAYQFEIGHPRNGETYVQHPLAKNRYIDINSFNTTLLERKYDELTRVLLALGASSISCAVSNDTSSGHKQNLRRHVDVDGKVAYGGASGSYDGNTFSDRTSALNKKLSCRIERVPNKKPYLPKDTVFFQFEDRWQQMAEDVLSGQRKREEVDLSYRKEYSLSCTEARQIGVKLESLIPGFQFGGSANYSDEYEAELKELESIVWHYEVEFGGVESVEVGAESENGDDSHRSESQLSTADVGKAEAMILNRAKRYVKTEEATKSGMLTDAQRADLEKLASKYGVEDLRLEELIDEAFSD